MIFPIMQKNLKNCILKGNEMKRLEINEVRKYQLEMLKYIDDVCRINDIEYSLAYGTLLGAIRHKGYIPWDDDVDIMLEFSNYEKLLNIMKIDGKFDILTPSSDKYAFCYSKLVHPETTAIYEDEYKHNDKIRGVFIDIFPLFPINNSASEIKLLKFYEECSLVSLEKGVLAFRKTAGIIKSLLRMPYVIFCKSLGKDYWSSKILTFIKKKNETCKYYNLFPWSEKRSMDKNIFRETMDMPFENLNLRVYKEYDKILTTMYGDYMQLPPEKDRVAHNVVILKCRKGL